MEIQKERSLAGTPGLLDISPPPLPPPPPPPIPAGGLEHRREFVNSKRQLAWPGSLQDLDHAPRIFSCLLTLHEQDLLLSHFRQLLSHGRPLGLIRCPLELLLELGNLRSELDKLA